VSNSLASNAPLIRRRLLRWYDRHHRKLEWRNFASDPYKIWVSEIMLQQTRVEVVKPYYSRFLRRFPTLADLAAAQEQEVLTLWSGLGYYRRARMLHQGAKKVMADHAGKLPSTAALLGELPGIGRYTASAIASISFGEVTAVVDGNVERVLQRIAGTPLRSKEQWQVANELVSPRRPGDFNQAMMELGATVCTPLDPKCTTCPIRNLCKQQGRQLLIAPKQSRRKKVVQYALDIQGDRVRLNLRDASLRLMPGMWELPQVPRSSGVPAFTLKHSITTTDYVVRVFKKKLSLGSYVAVSELSMLPLTGLTRKVLRKARIII
jgi:A/G-specific adenine glycosylase